MRSLILVAAMALVAVAGCSRRDTPVVHGNRHGILHLGNGAEPQNLDPHRATGISEHNILSALLEGLVTEAPASLEPRPGTAERWTVSDDGLTYTFHLREEARWSNGDPVTAQDFAFSFRRILSPGLGAPYAYMLYCLKGAEAFHRGDTDDFGSVGVSTPDTHTLILSLRTPVPYFLSLLNHCSWFPVHPPTIQAAGPIDALGTTWTRPGTYVGNGAFRLQSWEPNKVITVQKSETYWNHSQVQLNAVHFHAIAENSIEEHAFRAGQLHVTGTVPLDRIAHYRRQAPDRLLIHPYLGCYYYLFNVRRPPLDDPRVRMALALAIDREQLVEHVTRGGELPAYHFTPPDTAGYTATARLSGSVAEARQLLAEAGYPDGEGMRTLELLYNSSEAHADIAAVIQQMWSRNLGIEVRLVNMEWKVYVEQTQRGAFDIARAGWIGDYLDPNTFLDMWVTDGGNNRAGWSSPDYDAHIRAAAAGTSQAARFAAFQAAEAILMREVPIMPVYFYVSKSLIQPSVRGWHPNILDRHPLTHLSLHPE